MAEKNDAPENTTPAEQPVELSHTQGGTTTRSDLTDLGVPVVPGDPKEPQGPEDALGEGLKRGDYTARIGEANYQPHQAVAIPDAKPGEPRVRMVAQRPLTEQIGDEPGKKGGVETV